MSYRHHTFFFKDESDYIRQLDMELQRVTAARMEAYEVVRARYGFANKASSFCMRLKRFLRAGGTFPHVTGSKGKKILQLAITPALDACLRRKK